MSPEKCCHDLRKCTSVLNFRNDLLVDMESPPINIVAFYITYSSLSPIKVIRTVHSCDPGTELFGDVVFMWSRLSILAWRPVVLSPWAVRGHPSQCASLVSTGPVGVQLEALSKSQNRTFRPVFRAVREGGRGDAVTTVSNCLKNAPAKQRT
jgi:hypothetical protein